MNFLNVESNFLLIHGDISVKAACQHDLEICWNALAQEDGDLVTCRPRQKRTFEEAQKIFSSLLEDFNICIFAVFYKTDCAGKITFSDYNSRNRSAEVGYSMLPRFRKQNIMYSSMNLLLNYIFKRSLLNKVYAQTGEFNASSINLLRRLGFALDGCLREHHNINGFLYNDLIFSLLKSEYELKSKPISKV